MKLRPKSVTLFFGFQVVTLEFKYVGNNSSLAALVKKKCSKYEFTATNTVCLSVETASTESIVHCCNPSLNRICPFFHVKKIQAVQHTGLAFPQGGLEAVCEIRFFV